MKKFFKNMRLWAYYAGAFGMSVSATVYIGARLIEQMFKDWSE